MGVLATAGGPGVKVEFRRPGPDRSRTILQVSALNQDDIVEVEAALCRSGDRHPARPASPPAASLGADPGSGYGPANPATSAGVRGRSAGHMGSTGTAPAMRRSRLRAITARHHETVDAMIASGALLDTAAGYRNYLTATLLARRSSEERLSRSGVVSLYPGWPGRRVAHLVEADLADLAPDGPCARLAAAAHASATTYGAAPYGGAGPSGGAAPSGGGETLSAGAMLGMLYVLEGSAIGARVIARRAAAIGMGPGFGARHLHHQAAEPLAWPKFLALLEAYELTPQEDAACLQQAVATFECFMSHYRMAA